MVTKIFDTDKRQKDDILFKDKRTDPRYTSEISIDFFISEGTANTFYEGFTEDISLGGVFLATHQIYPIGSAMTLNLNLVNQKITVKAVVRWIKNIETFEDSETSPGMGLQFVDLSAKDKTLIDEFLKQREPMFVDVD